MTFKEQIYKIFCTDCVAYDKELNSCKTCRNSTKDYCLMIYDKIEQLFELRSPEGYRLAIVYDKAKLPQNPSQYIKLSDYLIIQQDMIKDGYIKEIKDG